MGLPKPWPDVKISVDGVACRVTSLSMEQDAASRLIRFDIKCVLRDEEYRRVAEDREAITGLREMVAQP